MNRPSVLLITIGDNFEPGVKESYEKAIDSYHSIGGKAELRISKNMCLIPYFGLNAMRNFHLCKARLEGWDYAFLLDNDILLDDERVIEKLVARGKDYIVPYIPPMSGGANVLMDPVSQPNTGLQTLNWAAVCCEMIDLKMLDFTGPHPFSESFIQFEDEFTCLNLRVWGIDIYQDTDTHAQILRESTIKKLIDNYSVMFERIRE